MTRKSPCARSPTTLRAQELCAQNDLPGILTNWHKRLAFERVMEVLGEAVKRLPPDLCQRYPAVPWKLIAGMRDRVSHGYDALDYAILWDTVSDDVPGLLATVEQMLKDLDSGKKK
ncbi:MAG: HepT-like ribonuclease domain-containing protein [Limisphaerales bacterium]